MYSLASDTLGFLSMFPWEFFLSRYFDIYASFLEKKSLSFFPLHAGQRFFFLRKVYITIYGFSPLSLSPHIIQVLLKQVPQEYNRYAHHRSAFAMGTRINGRTGGHTGHTPRFYKWVRDGPRDRLSDRQTQSIIATHLKSGYFQRKRRRASHRNSVAVRP